MPASALVLSAAALFAAALSGTVMRLSAALAQGPAGSPALGPGLWAGLALGLALGGALAARRTSERERPARHAALLCILIGGVVALLPLALDHMETLLGLLASALAAMGALASTTPAALADVLPALSLGLPVGVGTALAASTWLRARCMDLDVHGRALGRVALFACLGCSAGAYAHTLWAGAEVPDAQWLRGCALALWAAALLLLVGDRPLPHGTSPPPGGQPGTVAQPRRLLTWAGAASVALALGLSGHWRLEMGLLLGLDGATGLAATVLAGGALLGLFLGGELAGWRGERGYGAALPLLLCALLLAAPVWLRTDLPLDLLSGPAGERADTLAWYLLITIAPVGLGLGLALIGLLGQLAQWSGQPARELGRLLVRVGAGLTGGLLLAAVLPALGLAPAVLLLCAVAAVAVCALGLRIWTAPESRVRWFVLHGAVPLLLGLPLLHQPLLAAPPHVAAYLAAAHPAPPALRVRDAEDLALYGEFFAGDASNVARRDHGPFDDAIVLGDGTGGHLLFRETTRLAQIARAAPGAAQEELAPAIVAACSHRTPQRVLVLGYGSGRPARILRATDAQVVVADAPAHLRRLAGGLLPEPQPAGIHARPGSGVLSVLAAATGSDERYDLILRWNPDETSGGAAWLGTRAGVLQAHAALREAGALVLAVRPDLIGSNATDRLTRLLVEKFARVLAFRFEDQVVFVGQLSSQPLPLARWSALLEGQGPLAEAGREAGIPTAADLLSRLRADEVGLRRTLRLDDPPARPAPVDAQEAPREFASDPLAALLIDAAFPPDWNQLLPNHQIQEQWLTRATLAAVQRGDRSAARALGLQPALGARPEALRARAQVLHALGDGQAAERMLRAPAQEQPEDEPLWVEWVEMLPAAPEQEARQLLLDAGNSLGPEASARRWQAIARAARGLGATKLATEAYSRAVAAEPPAGPPGVSVEWARLLLSDEPGDAEGARQRLAVDPQLLEDPAGLELAVHLEGRLGDPGRADALEGLLLEAAERLARPHLREALQRLRARDYLRAYAAAERAAGIDGRLALAREAQGLSALCIVARNESEGMERASKATEALGDAIERRHPDPVQRAARILSWFGLSTASSVEPP